MDFSKLFSYFLFFTPLFAVLFPMAPAQNSNLFREYIGAQDKGVKFTDVPINPDVQFHFILAFAIDYTTTSNPPSPTNGQFNAFWDTVNLSASAVASIKQSHSNVKVALGLAGSSVRNIIPATFHPTSIDSWVSNAVSSLTSIIQEYHLDGIDIDYENFSSSADADTFAECIGQLITTLKNNGVIQFASIAPYEDEPLQTYYKALWAKYSSVIDYVNFQFYGYPSSTTVSQFLGYYDTQSSNYEGGKILTSLISDDSEGLTPENGFFDACKTLQDEGRLFGIFIWSADSSKANGFKYEVQAQALLANA